MRLIPELDSISPAELFGAWPRDRHILALLSGPAMPGALGGSGGEQRAAEVGGSGAGDARWSILTEADRTYTESFPGSMLAGGQRPARPRGEDEPPFIGGFIGYFSYDHSAPPAPRPSGTLSSASPMTAVAAVPAPPLSQSEGFGLEVWGAWPTCQFHRCPAALCHDAARGVWWLVGQARADEALLKVAMSAAGLVRAMRAGKAGAASSRGTPGLAHTLGPLATSWSRQGYMQAVLAAKEHIARGDVYQVNLTHQLRGSFSGSARSLMLSMQSSGSAWFGAYIESPDLFGQRRVLCGQSPELFLRMVPRADGTTLVQTRPMKGTRPASAGPAGEGELLASEKELAELTMIIDLMRNDLGRVCVPGSVRVSTPRGVEHHGAATAGVLQATATVEGVLPAGQGYGPLLQATLPGGSVTGAPKISAMRIISELEPHRRGPYCGAVGYFSTCGRAELAMMIRTAMVHGVGVRERIDEFAADQGCEVVFPVGAGIVADSQAEEEWAETLTKARVITG